MKGPGALARLIRRRWLRWMRSRAEIDRLAAVDHPLAAPLARALRGTLDGDAKAETARLEALRRKTNASTEPLPVRELVPEGRGPVLETITVGRASRVGSKSPEWCRMLYGIVYETRAGSILEMGTNMGISAAYQASAQVRSGVAPRFVSVEGQPDSVDAARRHLASLGLDFVELVAGPFDAVLGGVLEARGPFDYVFVDGHHDGPATVGYHHRLAEHLSTPAVVVFDDIDWTEGMRRAWREIAADDRWAIVVDLMKIGVGVFDPESGAASRHRIAIR